MEEADNHIPKQLRPYTWKKGVSANPAGRPKGKTLKTFAREYLESLPDDEKVEYLASLPTDIVWKMAEGNPDTSSKLEVDIPQNLIDIIKNAHESGNKDIPTESSG